MLCECGCGVDAGVYSVDSNGKRKGEPKRFIWCHSGKMANTVLHSMPKPKRTHCARGHELSSNNVRIGSRGYGRCIICVNMDQKDRQDNLKASGFCVHGHKKNRENTDTNGSCKVCRENHCKRRYGISLEEVDLLLKRQHNRCAICPQEFNKENRPRIDHKHGSVNARGLLCHGCNIGLGCFKENPDVLQSAIQYLKETQ